MKKISTGIFVCLAATALAYGPALAAPINGSASAKVDQSAQLELVGHKKKHGHHHHHKKKKKIHIHLGDGGHGHGHKKKKHHHHNDR